MGVQMGRCEGATAEKAVPFPCAARRSLLRHACVKRCKGQRESMRCGRENYRAKAKKFARLAAVAKSPRFSRQCRKLAEMYWALALGEEPEHAPPSKSNVKGSTTWPPIP